MTPELSELHAAPEIKNVAMLIHSLAATEAALAAALPDEVDAVISPITATPFLLQRAQVALHLSERRYRHLLSRMAAIVFELKPDGTILYVNDAVQQATGYPAQELIGKNWWRTFFPGDAYRQVTALHIRLRQGDVSNLELDLTTSSGSRITMELNTANRYAADGTLQQFLGLGVDITERKIANTQVQFQANLLNTIDQSVIATDLEDKVIYWNRFAEVLYGCSPTEAIGQFVSELVTSLKTPDQSTEMIARIKNGESWTGEFDVRRRDGTVFPVVVISSPIYDANGSLVGMIHVSADISERRRAEEALKESEKAEREQRELAEALLDSAATLTSVLDPTLVMNRILENVGRVITHESANIMLIDGDMAYMAYWRGYPADLDLLVKTRFPLDSPIFHQMLATGLPVLVEDVSIYPGWVTLPETNWIRSFASAPIQSHGQTIGFLNVDGDETKRFGPLDSKGLQAFANQAAIAIENAQLYDELRRHSAELERRVEERTAELHEAKERLETIFNSSTDAIVVVGQDGLIGQKNPSFRRLFGFQPGDARGLSLVTLAAPGSVEALKEALNIVAVEATPRQIELVAQQKDGTHFDAELILSPIVDPGRQTSGVICNVRDITPRKQMEIGLRKTVVKERELGELKSRFLSMASHDFRTPLAVILASASLLKLHHDKLPAKDLLRHLDNIHVGVNQMTELLDDVLTFTQGEEGHLKFKPTLLDLEVLCRQMMEETQIAIGKTHNFAFTSQYNCEDACIDKKLLRQILNNLLSNAAKYSPEGSTVHFDLSCERGQAVMRVQDYGLGIPDKDQAGLFEPFHRADNVNSIRLTGLGLAIVKRAVELHHGTITFESQVGVGTTFTVVISTLQENQV